MGFLDKVKDDGGKAADQAKHATAVGKEKLEDARLQKKINDLCQEIGELVVAQRRNEAPEDAAAQIDAKIAEIAEIEKQMEANDVDATRAPTPLPRPAPSNRPGSGQDDFDLGLGREHVAVAARRPWPRRARRRRAAASRAAYGRPRGGRCRPRTWSSGFARRPRPPEPAEHRLRAFDAGLGQHHRELLAAVAGDTVDLAGRLAQVAGQQAQRLVTDLVAVPIVHLLEVIEVDEHQRVAGLHGATAPGRTCGGSRAG